VWWTVAIGWPLRYSHSPAEVIDLKDVVSLADIIRAVAETGEARALLSVSDKRGIVELARELVALGWEIVSTGAPRRRCARRASP